ncbi:AP-3 complex subunit delta-1 [Clydaea vesicula]|uniref:AP-3 complex subunit delta-1 n=1 Tax=Clydaea vesicula TaxID=447962 RepID=A0AAD5XYI2_9FUNG|nr:AP-3 complex subunit delta-1 [Clydaea vesicula]
MQNIFFRQSLTDLIRGLRANKLDEEKFISSSIDQIRIDLKTTDEALKASCLQKLAYLHLLGYDMRWANFNIIEILSSQNINYKRIAYMTAAVSFDQDTDVIMLCTNQIKKDLHSNNYLEAAIALHGLAQIITPDLGRDLCQDLIAMMNHSKPHIRKRVILVLYKVFLKYPDALRLAYPRLKEKLEDKDNSVICAAVNVICELARKNPKSYLPLAPILYGHLTNSTNNWMLIKIVKLFAALMPLEPRLVKKLQEPISHLLATTNASSLLYECIHTAIEGGMITAEEDDSEESFALYNLVVDKLKLYLNDKDQNLKYLGLFALSKLLKIRPNASQTYKEIVLACLDDSDSSIRTRSLEIICAMVNEDNLIDIVNKLLSQLISSDAGANPNQCLNFDQVYRENIVKKVISISSKDLYRYVSDFEWYIKVLYQIATCQGISLGKEISDQLIDVTVRVQEVKVFTDKQMLESLSIEKSNSAVFYGAAWIVGEFINPSFIKLNLLFDTFLLKDCVSNLEPSIQAVLIHASLKIFIKFVASSTINEILSDICVLLKDYYSALSSSSHLEVQERASMSLALVSVIESSSTPVEQAIDFLEMFDGEFNPVAEYAQNQVGIPEGLDLDAWISEPIIIDEERVVEVSNGEYISISNNSPKKSADPYYINKADNDSDDIDSIPMVNLDLDENISIISVKKQVVDITAGKKSIKSKQYKINRSQGEVPDGGIILNTSTKKVEKVLDADTMAVMSVDLTTLEEDSRFIPVSDATSTQERTIDVYNEIVYKKKGKGKGKAEKKEKKKKKNVFIDEVVESVNLKDNDILNCGLPPPLISNNSDSEFDNRVVFNDDQLLIKFNFTTNQDEIENQIAHTESEDKFLITIFLKIKNKSSTELTSLKLIYSNRLDNLIELKESTARNYEKINFLNPLKTDQLFIDELQMELEIDKEAIKFIPEQIIDVHLQTDTSEHKFPITLPISINIRKQLNPISPVEFELLLKDEQNANYFKYEVSTQFRIANFNNFDTLISTDLVNLLRLKVIQSLSGEKIAVFGKLFFFKENEEYIAGVIELKQKNGLKGVILCKFKGGNKIVLDALIDDVHKWELENEI